MKEGLSGRGGVIVVTQTVRSAVIKTTTWSPIFSFAANLKPGGNYVTDSRYFILKQMYTKTSHAVKDQ